MKKMTTIRNRLISVMLYLALFILVVNSLLLFVRDRRRIKNNLVHETQMQAILISESSLSPLYFNDKHGILDVLEATDSVPGIKYVAILDEDGGLFAERKKKDFILPKDSLRFDTSPISSDFIQVTQPIIFERGHIGTVVILTSVELLNKQLFETFYINFLILGLLIIVAYLLSLFLQRTISLPIEKLADDAAGIAESGKYESIKSDKVYYEIANLYSSINNMLDTISRKEHEQNELHQSLIQNKKHLQSIIDSAPLAFAVVDSAMNVEYVNPEFSRLFGWKADEIEDAAHWFKLAYPDIDYRKKVISEFKQNLEYSVKNDCPTQPHEVHIISKDENMRIVEVVGCPIEGGMLYIYSDITERRKTDEAVVRLNKELELKIEQRTSELNEVNNELETFAYSVSHDLRAPLRGIHGFVSALIEDKKHLLDDDGLHYLDRISEGSMKMAQLIDDILNLSRISRQSIFKKRVDLTRIAKTILRELKDTSRSRNVNVIIQDSIIAYGDEMQLTIMLTNLISNAWKYSSKSANPSVTIGRSSHMGREVFFVKDNGTGFNMAYYDKLFTPFQRLHNETEFKGTGIGLATVSRIIEKHDGKIWAESEVGKGAVFYIWLPKEE